MCQWPSLLGGQDVSGFSVDCGLHNQARNGEDLLVLAHLKFIEQKDVQKCTGSENC